MQTLLQPLILYRHHGYGNIHKVHPYVIQYRTEEDFNKAVKYNLIHRPTHALFSSTEILHPGKLTSDEATIMFERIKDGEFKTSIGAPKIAVDLHTH